MSIVDVEQGPSEDRAEILDLLCELASSVARAVTQDWLPNDQMHATPEQRMLVRARRLLVLNGKHCPLVIDEALDLMERHRPKAD